MTEHDARQLLLLTDDDFLADVIGTYLSRDGIGIIRLASAEEAARRALAGANVVLVDLAKRGVNGEAIMSLALRAQRANIPLLVMSAQPRREVAEFAAVVRANDVISKTERMGTIAARLRMWMNTPRAQPNRVGAFAIPEFAVASL